MFPLCGLAETEMAGCRCGRTRAVFSREDIFEMEATSQQFEQDEGVLAEIERDFPLGCGDDGYAPYCGISIEVGFNDPERSHHRSVDFVPMSKNGNSSDNGGDLIEDGGSPEYIYSSAASNVSLPLQVDRRRSSFNDEVSIAMMASLITFYFG